MIGQVLIIVTEKVSVVNYRIKLRPEGSSKVVHVDQLQLDPCHQKRINWIRDEMTCCKMEIIATRDTDQLHLRTAAVGVSLACPASDHH